MARTMMIADYDWWWLWWSMTMVMMAIIMIDDYADWWRWLLMIIMIVMIYDDDYYYDLWWFMMIYDDLWAFMSLFWLTGPLIHKSPSSNQQPLMVHLLLMINKQNLRLTGLVSIGPIKHFANIDSILTHLWI